ncbi:hypothetical protein OIE13_04225 [Streptosporangium sp. NBC_01810]|uniref:hypothetical protein n=1 Tax=Streptosporangium sp. NBC_01810 TaxID=2975951 RepID=UPI002DDBACB0|nr:hypothetical protein [Streptosporangium sp. NBC_01810]WSA27103.1 hypothetical protein OIE13_04225 [Streptosporangium sp. NBC_01810]
MEQLAFTSTTLVNFKDRTYRWVDVKHFRIASGQDDEPLLTALLSHQLYRDDYLGSDSWKGDGSVHGPYRLDSLSAASFEDVDTETASATIRTWADRYTDLPEAVAHDLETEVYRLIRAATSRYRLRDLDEAARDDDLGWILGEFHELVLIDRSEGSLAVIVASDD